MNTAGLIGRILTFASDYSGYELAVLTFGSDYGGSELVILSFGR